MPRRERTPEQIARGQRLKAAAKLAGYNSATIGEVVGVQDGTVRGWWRGLNWPDPDRLRSYAKATHVSTDYLLYGPNEPPESSPTLQEWRLRYADLVRGGMSAEEAIDAISGGPAVWLLLPVRH